jgi:hypothetical protein
VKTEKGGSFADFEKDLHRRLMELEREVIAGEMAGADIDAGAVVVDGVTYRRVVRCEGLYFTAAGPVCVERTLYKDRTDETGRSISPMDLRLGIVEGRWTPVAAEQATWVVAQMTPQLAEDLFQRMGNMTPSKSSLDRLPKVLSARWEADRVHFEQALRDGDVIPAQATTIAVFLDGVLAPMKDGDAQGKRQKTASEGRLTRGPAGYREVGCGTLSFCDERGDLVSAVRMGRMPEPRKATLKRTLLADATARPGLAPRLAHREARRWRERQLDVPVLHPARRDRDPRLLPRRRALERRRRQRLRRRYRRGAQALRRAAVHAPGRARRR